LDDHGIVALDESDQIFHTFVILRRKLLLKLVTSRPYLTGDFFETLLEFDSLLLLLVCGELLIVAEREDEVQTC
jgi:hypothetical protein